jgi:hypothetical protein
MVDKLGYEATFETGLIKKKWWSKHRDGTYVESREHSTWYKIRNPQNGASAADAIREVFCLPLLSFIPQPATNPDSSQLLVIWPVGNS